MSVHLHREPSGVYVATRLAPSEDIGADTVRVTAVRQRRRIQRIDKDGRAVWTRWGDYMSDAEYKNWLGWGNKWGW
jgi:hypothetical protein